MRCEHCEQPIATDRRVDSIYCGRRCRQAAWKRARRLATSSATRSSSTRQVSPLQHPPVACPWCGEMVPSEHRRDSKYCSRRCRQSGFRLRRLRAATALHSTSTPLRLAYADPPYPGLAKRYYDEEESYAGEVDHGALLEQLRAFDGWALSTSARALRVVLPLCPPEARVCAWVKPGRLPWARAGVHNRWEPLIVVPARALAPGFPDCLQAQPARLGGTMMGRKPIAFCAWLFHLLGAVPGVDALEDLFPGTGIVGRAWEELSSRARSDASTSAAQRVGEDLQLHARDAGETVDGNGALLSDVRVASETAPTLDQVEAGVRGEPVKLREREVVMRLLEALPVDALDA